MRKPSSPDPIPPPPVGISESWRRAPRILAQELRGGCTDRTVIGGLEKLASNLAASIPLSDEHTPFRSRALRIVDLLRGYGGLAIDERRAAALAALELTKELLGEVASAEASGSPNQLRSTPAAASPTVVRAPRESRERDGRAAAGGGSPSAAGRPPEAADLDDPVVVLKGVGKLRAAQLARLGIQLVRDLLGHFPRDYRDYRPVKRIVDLMYGETASVLGVVEDVQVIPGARRLFRTTVRVRDETGRISATWFRYGYGGLRVSPNSRIVLAGTVSGFSGHLVFDGPDWEPADREPLHTRRLVPAYPLTEGLSDYWMRGLMAGLVPRYAPLLDDPLPDWLVRGYGLMSLSDAIVGIHLPRDPEEVARARHRLAFEELFLVQLAALRRRAEWQAGGRAHSIQMDDSAMEGFLACQPFSLTTAQAKAVEEIRDDLRREIPMTRLLQGDVGSGKTIVAAVALLSAVMSGCQGALMAPTEILAEQHGRTLGIAYRNAREVLDGLMGRPLNLEVLTSASRRSDRERVYGGAAEGSVDILVGTQALIQEGLGVRKLGLVVIDEQHRFGVAQRSSLRDKGGTPHLLVMTATPIPRTLALTLYGDLDLTIIGELPPGRQRVKTHLLGPLERAHAYEHVRREVAQGRQAFIICPLVEDSPHLEVRAATAEYERLRQGELSSLRLGLLHGRMRPAEKDRIMLEFRNGGYDVLVSTSVVEVGIDVPNATVVLVEGAERFGLAQLHQFRGRVGRGMHPSSCLLLTDSAEDTVLQRLQTVVLTSDGFHLAEEDLRLRGPGEYLGARQSGFPDLRMADLRDLRLIETARAAAVEVLRRDPGLSAMEHRGLAILSNRYERTGAS